MIDNPRSGVINYTTSPVVPVEEEASPSTITSADGTSVAVDGSEDEGALRVRDPEVAEAIERLTAAVNQLTTIILSNL